MNARFAFVAAIAALVLSSASAVAEEKARFYCDRTALTAEQRVQIFTFGHTLHDAVQSARELPNGYEFEFASDAPIYQALKEDPDGEMPSATFIDGTSRPLSSRAATA